MNKELFIKQGRCSWCPPAPGLCLYFGALISSIFLMGIEPVIQIKRPWVLLAVAFVGLLPVKDKSFVILKKLLVVYFVGMLMSQLAMENIVIGGQTLRVILPKSLIPLFLYAAGFILDMTREPIGKSLKRNALWYRLWVIVVIVFMVHMFFLWIPLKLIYGFGYGYHIKVLVRIALYAMCFFFIWDILDKRFACGFSIGCIVIPLLLMVL